MARQRRRIRRNGITNLSSVILASPTLNAFDKVSQNAKRGTRQGSPFLGVRSIRPTPCALPGWKDNARLTQKDRRPEERRKKDGNQCLRAVAALLRSSPDKQPQPRAGGPRPFPRKPSGSPHTSVAPVRSAKSSALEKRPSPKKDTSSASPVQLRNESLKDTDRQNEKNCRPCLFVKIHKHAPQLPEWREPPGR